MNNQCPELIREWIDNDVLPNYADGYNTPKNITLNLCVNARDRIDLEFDDVNFYSKISEDSLIDSWLIAGKHDELVMEYIQTVFDSWEKEGETE